MREVVLVSVKGIGDKGVDEVRNPWRRRKGVVVFDIETDMLERWYEHDKREAKFRCGVAFVYDKNSFYEFTKPKKFVEILKRAKALVSYNGEGFDFLVLEKYGLRIRKYKDRWRPEKIDSFDIMHTLQENRPRKNRGKKYPKLEELMTQHYGIIKTRYDHEKQAQLLRHCREDVEYTVKLYEEGIWQVPIKTRESRKRCWEHYYDDDISGVVWDGETWTDVNDFGMPIKSNIGAESARLCPGCKAKRLSLRRVAQGKESEVVCPQCGTVMIFSPANEIVSIQSQKEYGLSVCKKCGKRIEAGGYAHYGYGAGSGYLRSGRSICPVCDKGCYEWGDDETPGFRDHWKGKCCRCKRDIGEWNVSGSRRPGRAGRGLPG
jgi:hypothetical protein